MLPYRHTQVGALVFVFVGIPVAVLALVTLFVGVDAVVLATLGLLIIALLLFGTLTVEVDRDSVGIRFGPGLIRKRFPLSEIRGVKAVRNQWFYGLGIRLLSTGWLYSVSGLDAIELEMANGARHRIGTDRPQDLEAAVREALGLQIVR